MKPRRLKKFKFSVFMVIVSSFRVHILYILPVIIRHSDLLILLTHPLPELPPFIESDFWWFRLNMTFFWTDCVDKISTSMLVSYRCSRLHNGLFLEKLLVSATLLSGSFYRDRSAHYQPAQIPAALVRGPPHHFHTASASIFSAESSVVCF